MSTSMGDRVHEVLDTGRERIRDVLDDAPLTDAEFAAGQRVRSNHPDPFPSWGVLHQHG
ncbi:hypothetical protein [Nocardia nova]|uniref:hypothetical protein n=1 Tax=Nocardia nova TaxID=37330 RepID=UPI0033D37CCB